MKIKKYFSFLLASLFAVLSYVHPSYAHTTSQASQLLPDPDEPNFLGGERYGWSIDEHHHSDGYYTTYFIYQPSPLDRTYKKISPELIEVISGGAYKWRSSMGFRFERFSVASAAGTIYAIINPDTDRVASMRNPQTLSNGHMLSWTITLNLHYPITEVTLAHEFGHVLGLQDLGALSNKNRLMYGGENRTAKAPTTYEKHIALTITGMFHQTHTWTGGYQYLGVIDGVCYHTKKCKYCNGPSVAHKVRCTYNANHVCKYCGGRPTV